MTINQIAKLLQSKTVKQVIRQLCGEKLGSGLYRDVYAVKGSDKYVIKIEYYNNNPMYCNITEWRNWCQNKEWKWLAPYLAPCPLMTLDGQILVQRRVEFKEKKLYPKQIPAVFTDLHYKNFGWIGDQFVCCDFAFMVLCAGKGPRPMKRARWRNQVTTRSMLVA